MKIAAKMIVFQADSVLPKDMLRLCIENIYPHVDQLLICEGATNGKDPNHWDGDTRQLTTTGESTDGTLGILTSIVDPDGKITFVRTNGFADGKTSMFNRLAELVRDDIDYVWQIDSDEFYHENAIRSIKQLLERSCPDVVQFFAYHFFGDFSHCISSDSGHLWGNDIPWTRIFKHEPLARWRSHEPPIYCRANGQSLFEGKVISREETKALGLFLFHYSCVARSQAQFKSIFFRNPDYIRLFDEWKKDPTIPLINGSKTQPFVGDHPLVIKNNYL